MLCCFAKIEHYGGYYHLSNIGLEGKFKRSLINILDKKENGRNVRTLKYSSISIEGRGYNLRESVQTI